MGATLGELAALVAGDLIGDGSLVIEGAATLAESQGGQITFIDAPDRARLLQQSQATAAVVPSGVNVGDLPCIAVADVPAAFAQIVSFFRPPRAVPRGGRHPAAWISPLARLAGDVCVQAGATIDDHAQIGPGCWIHAGARIGPGCILGRNVTVFSNAVLYENTVVGDDVIIHANAVVGAYGFGYKTTDGRHQLSPQLGYVVLEDQVEVGAGTTIDRGTYGPTTIGQGTKIDNLVMIAHNCRIGKHNLICSQAGIAGSTTTGDYVVIAGQAGLRDHVHIGDRAVICAKAGVSNSVDAGQVVIGSPAIPQRDFKLQVALLSKLPQMRQQLKELVKQAEQQAPGGRPPAAGQAQAA